MSLYQFIASDYEIPEILSEKKHNPDGSDKLEFDSEADLEALDIKKLSPEEVYPDVPFYTNRDYLYELDWHPRAAGNIECINSEMRDLEIITVSADDISEEILRDALDYSSGISTPTALRIY